MLIVFVSKGRAAAEAAAALYKLETRMTGLDGRSAVIATAPDVRSHVRRDDAVDFAALGTELLLDPGVRLACDAVVAVAEGGRSEIEDLARAVREANATPGAPAFLLGSGRHHPSERCAILPVRHPTLPPGPGYARALYVALLREMLPAVRADAARGDATLPAITGRLRSLGADRRTPATSSGRRRSGRRPAGFPRVHVDERWVALGGAR